MTADEFGCKIDSPSEGGFSMDMTTMTAAIIIGTVFVLVGILGFIPNPIVSRTGFFAVNPAHNIVHIVSGAAILAAAYTAIGAGIALKVFGVIYGLIALLGLFTNATLLLGFIRTNHADHWLHVVLAVVILAAGFMLRDEPTAAGRSV
jgi:hypothetical protein